LQTDAYADCTFSDRHPERREGSGGRENSPKSDPNFDRAIADYVDAEASLTEDPAEGQREDMGSAQARILELING
jgi:hypothetical protein